MTKNPLQYLESKKQVIKLTHELVAQIDFTKVIYGERTQSGGMGNAGGIILYVIEGKKLARYETNCFSDEPVWVATMNRIVDNEELFHLYAGGMGNGVFIKRGIELENEEDISEDGRWNSHFIYTHKGVKHPIFSSVYGVHKNIARALKNGNLGEGLDEIHKGWEESLRVGRERES